MNIKVLIIVIMAFVISFLIVTRDNDTKEVKENIMDDKKEEIKETDVMTSFSDGGEIINVVLKTNIGEVKLELYPEKAPKTVENFVKLSQEGFYNGTKFHRVIKDFMIQGGDPLTKDDSQRSYWGTGDPGYKFEDEQNNIVLGRGVLAMANSGPNTNGSQFFIITAEVTPWLQNIHTGFGKVVSGMDIVEKMENSETNPSDQPLEDLIIEEAVVL